MPVDQLCNVYILNRRDPLHGGQTRDTADSPASRAEEVAEDPVVAGVPIDVAARDDANGFSVFIRFDDDGGAKDVDVLNKAVGMAALEFAEAGENDAGAEGVADEGYGADAEVAVDEGVGEDEACGVGTVEGDRPGVVEEVGELC